MFGECEAGTRPRVFCNINHSWRPLLLAGLGGTQLEGSITRSPLSCRNDTTSQRDQVGGPEKDSRSRPGPTLPEAGEVGRTEIESR